MLIEGQLIQLDYDFDGFLYSEKYTLKEESNNYVLSLTAGPYGSDYNAHFAVWNNWLKKVKELSESK